MEVNIKVNENNITLTEKDIRKIISDWFYYEGYGFDVDEENIKFNLSEKIISTSPTDYESEPIFNGCNIRITWRDKYVS